MCLTRTSGSCSVIEYLSSGNYFITKILAKAAGRIEIDLATEHLAQFLFHLDEFEQTSSHPGMEFDKYIDVASTGIEVLPQDGTE